MFCAFFCLLVATGGIGVLAWFAWRRATAPLQHHQHGGLQLPVAILNWAVPGLISFAAAAIVGGLKSWMGCDRESGSGPRT